MFATRSHKENGKSRVEKSRFDSRAEKSTVVSSQKSIPVAAVQNLVGGSPTNKYKKINKIEQYAQSARETQASHGTSSRDSGKSESSRKRFVSDMVRSVNRTLATEQHAINEIHSWRPQVEDPFSRSFDVRWSMAQFATQRNIDIGMWADGSGFKLTTRGGWYNSDKAVSVRKFLRTNAVWQTVTMVSVCIALFLSDVFTMLEVPSNVELDIILTTVLVIFGFEFLGLIAVDASYPFSFFFWMDLVGTFSLVFDISYMYGHDVTELRHLRERQGENSGNVVLVRAARAARLGARAGRLSRVLKIMKYFPVFQRGDQQEDTVKMAKVISNQLNEVLATRVAFLTICIAVTLPLFSMFTYPEVDDGLGAWTEALSLDVHDYHQALRNANTTRHAVQQTRGALDSELRRFSDFYSAENYGPFAICIGEMSPEFKCRSDHNMSSFDLPSAFTAPRRMSNVWMMRDGTFQVFFNLAIPNKLEAGANSGLIWFVIVVMILFGLIMSHSVSVIALQPLERMLSVVRERCAQIFKFTNDLQAENQNQEGDKRQDEEEMQNDETQFENEFVLLEKAVSKLAAVADLSGGREPEVTERMDEDEMLILNMTGVQVPSAHDLRSRTTFFRSGATTWAEQDDQDDEDDPDNGDHVLELQNQIHSKYLEAITNDDFDANAVQKDSAALVAAYIIVTNEGSYGWNKSQIPDKKLRNFLAACQSNYNANPFHNFGHALDVCWAISRFSNQLGEDVVNDISQFWLMIAAIGHDLKHEGVNNQYLIETSHKLAMTYNDRSPLENLHCSTLFQILGEAETNIFDSLERAVYKEMRKGMVDAILHTDITKHNDMVKSMSLLYQVNSEIFDAVNNEGDIDREEDLLNLLQSPANSQMINDMMLHCADVGNPTKPWIMAYALAQLCVDEFFAQGDLEKAAGLPVGLLNDREKVNLPTSQIGFIEFMIAPMVESVVRLFPQLDLLALNLGRNTKYWLDTWLQDSDPPADAVEKTTARVLKLRSRLMSLRGEDED